MTHHIDTSFFKNIRKIQNQISRIVDGYLYNIEFRIRMLWNVESMLNQLK